MLAVLLREHRRGALRPSRSHPPSHVETIDPTQRSEAIPASAPRACSVDEQGRVHAAVVGIDVRLAARRRWSLPADTPVTFHLTSVDVIHGYQIVRTNGQTMVLPGYVSQFTTQFDAGEYLVACNEYCGVGHHMMAGKLHVVPRASGRPAPRRSPMAVRPSSRARSHRDAVRAMPRDEASEPADPAPTSGSRSLAFGARRRDGDDAGDQPRQPGAALPVRPACTTCR